MAFLDRSRVSALRGVAQRAGRSVLPDARGVMPTHLPLATLDNRQLMEMFKKDMAGSPSGGLFGGFPSGGGHYTNVYRGGPGRLSQLQTAYGGTTDSVTWVFACVSLIAATVAAYPWRFVDDNEDTVEKPPPELVALLEKPNDDWTYFDLLEAIATDLELVGNCYILKNERNGLGQPLSLMRLLPDRVRIALNPDGTVRGYVYTPQNNGIQIPFDADEVLQFKYPNPMDPHYGMGTVEAIASLLDRAAAQDQHITGYFQNGARISGVLTIPSTMTDVQFERLKQTYSEQFAGPAAAYKMLIAEGASDYKPITQGPAASGTVELMGLAKDEILGSFGVPAPMLGGLMENANYKMEDAQQIMLRALIPKARRISDTMTNGLAQLWGVDFRLDPHANEPMSVRAAYAKELIGSGARVAEAREAAGLPALEPGDPDYESAQKILIPNTLIPLDIAGQPPRPPHSMPLGDSPEQSAIAQGVAAGSGVPTLADHLADLPEQVAAGKLADAVAALEDVRAKLAEITEPAEVESEPDPPPAKDPPAPETPPAARRDVLAAAADLTGVWARRRPKATEQPREHFNEPWEDAPDLPHGFEPVTHGRTGDARIMRQAQARALRVGVDTFRPAFRKFFRDQRDRVIAELAQYGSTNRATRLRGKPTKAKDDLEPDALFDSDGENEKLLAAYLPALDAVGKAAARSIPPQLGGGLEYTLENPALMVLRDQLAAQVVQINETTRQAISQVVTEGMRRGYSIPQIANGYPDEDYPGIMGVFDQADDARAETIARTETAYAYNGVQAASYDESGVEYVEILDGRNFDQACADADGQVWPLAEYQANPIEHPNCSRTAVPAQGPPD